MCVWAYHTDICALYNKVKLLKPFLCYQLYLWQKDLDPSQEPLLKVIMPLIYRVGSSGNQSYPSEGWEEHGEVPQSRWRDFGWKQWRIGAASHLTTTAILGICGFILKGVTVSAKDRDETLSADKESVMVGGLKWFPKGHFLMVNIDPLNFTHKVRGKKAAPSNGIPEELTVVDVTGKVAEFWFIPLSQGGD